MNSSPTGSVKSGVLNGGPPAGGAIRPIPSPRYAGGKKGEKVSNDWIKADSDDGEYVPEGW